MPIAFLALACCSVPDVLAVGQTVPGLHPYTATERGVVSMIAHGNTTISASEAGWTDKTLSAPFIDELLSMGAKSVPLEELSLDGFTIQGQVYLPLTHPHVPFSVEFIECKFEQDLSLNGVIDGGVSIVDSTVGNLYLDGAQIKGGVRITNEEQGHEDVISLAGAKVEGQVTLGPFRAPLPTTVDARGLVADSLELWSPLSARELDLDSIDVRTLWVGSYGGKSPTDSLRLTNANIKDTFNLVGVGLENLTANGMKVGSRTVIGRGAWVRNRLDLSSASLGSFEYTVRAKDTAAGAHKPQNRQPDWPKVMAINGVDFKSLSVVLAHSPGGSTREPDLMPSGIQPADNLNLEFLDHSDFYQPAFVSYQKILESSGQNELADRVNEAMHKQLRREMLRDGAGIGGLLKGAFTAFTDEFQGLFFGYGRTVLEPLVWSLVFIGLGAVIFAKERNMEAPEPEKAAVYSGFWYSLEMFLPVVDLGVAKGWRPRANPRWRLWYARIHQLAGWILIPVAIGVLTGSFR